MVFRNRKRILLSGVSGLTILLLLVGAFVFFHGSVRAATISGQSVPLISGGSASFTSAPMSTDFSTQANEVDTTIIGGDADGGSDDGVDTGINRTLPGTVEGNGKPVNPSANPKSNPVLGTNFEGLNLFNQRFANGGNQFSVEPPDQGLCAGNGFVLESVNDVLRMYHTDGSPPTGVIDLNTFYNYPAAIVRSGPNAGQEGPELTDPSCVFDRAIGRFVHVILTLDRVSPTNHA